MNVKSILLSLIMTLGITSIYALPEIPSELKEWESWAMDGYEKELCPEVSNNEIQKNNIRVDSPQIKTKICNWSNELLLSKNKNNINFSQTIKLFADSRITLPGDKDNVVNFVIVTNKENSKVTKVPVIYIDGYPTIDLNQGDYKIKGVIEGKSDLNKIKIPSNIASILIADSKEQIRLADIKNDYVYWNKIKSYKAQSNELVNKDTENLSVYREIFDDIPLQIVSHFKIVATGKERVYEIKDALLNDFKNIKITSNLPVEITDNSMKVYLKPGQHVIKIQSISEKSVPEIITATLDNEIWFFTENQSFRSVSFNGGERIDATHINTPFNKRNRPAQILNKNDEFTIKTTKAGYQDLQNSKVKAKRDLWIDFSGSFYTFRDQINTSNLSRIDYKKSNDLASVEVNGQPGYITLNNESLKGFELRSNNVSITSEGRIPVSPSKELGTTGLNMTVDSYSLNLHTPPGWKLLMVKGTGEASNSYINKWKLIDFFLVLLITVIFFKKWGVKEAAFVLAGLLVVYHMKFFNPFILINALIAITLYELLKPIIEKNENKAVLKASAVYSWASISLLSIVFVMFTFNTVRITLYPELEREGYYTSSHKSVSNYKSDYKERKLNSISDSIDMAMEEDLDGELKGSYEAKRAMAPQYVQEEQRIKQINNNLKTQTGYGIPEIKWNTYKVHWNGSISKNETSRFIFINPILMKILNIFGIITWLFIIYKLVQNQTGFTLRLNNKKEGEVENEDK